jgi:hypothetical protein
MKPRYAVLLAILMIIFCAAGLAQDKIELRNGSIIKGTIVAIIPDSIVTIQTADGSSLVYPMAEVLKITKEPVPTATEMPATADEEGSISNVTIFGGISLPAGAFGSTTGSDGGAAKTGFTFGIDANVPVSSAASWMTSVDFSSNSMDLGPALAGMGLSAEAGSWRSVWALTGFQLSAFTSSGLQIFGFTQVGVLFGRVPEINLRSGAGSATQSSASATALGFGVGGGVTVSHVSLGIRFVTGSPEYEVTATGTAGTFRGKFKQPTSCVLITGGVAF